MLDRVRRSFGIGRRRALRTPTAVMLYRTPECWRYSLVSPGGIACGLLDDLSPDCKPETAQRAVEQRAWEFSRRSLHVAWSAADLVDQWTGEVVTTAPHRTTGR